MVAALMIGLLLGPLHAAIPALALRFLRSHNPRLAHQQLSRYLEDNPDDPDGHLVSILLWARVGYPADALASVPFAQGSTMYAERGIDAHANALRATGRAGEAAALRAERLVGDLTAGQELLVLLALIDDHREGGTWDGALTAGEQAMSLYPRSPMLWATLAHVYHDMGRTDERDYHLWMSERGGFTAGRAALVHALIAMDDGDLPGALAHVTVLRRRQSDDRRARSVELEIYRRDGQLDHVAHMIAMPRWSFHEDPELRAAEVRALLSLGRSEEATALTRRLLELYPQHRLVASVAAEVVTAGWHPAD